VQRTRQERYGSASLGRRRDQHQSGYVRHGAGGVQGRFESRQLRVERDSDDRGVPVRMREAPKSNAGGAVVLEAVERNGIAAPQGKVGSQAGVQLPYVRKRLGQR